jgi:DNA-binding response OmpR family regulator
MTTILLAEDDPNLGFVVKDNLEINGFEVFLCEDGEKAWQAFSEKAPDICILDVMMPRKDGIALARQIRQYNLQVPILFLTAKGMKDDRIAGFMAGGDDYITKPFSIEELILRINVFLKRSKNEMLPVGTIISLGKYIFDYQGLTLTIEHNSRTLTQKEAEVLKYFCDRKKQIVKREDILRAVWGDDDYFLGRSLDVFISKLRKYLQEDPDVEITNLHGVGFRLDC